MLVSTPRHLLWAWINSRTGIPLSQDFRAIGITRGDCLLGVVAYNGFTGRSCFMHSAIDDPSVIDRTFVRAIFEYPFLQCKLTHVLAMVDSSNSRALEIDKRCGFKEVYRAEGAGLDGPDMVLLELKRDDCRWIKGIKHGQEERASCSGLHSGGAASGAVVKGCDDAAGLREPPHDQHSVGAAVLGH